MIFNLDNDLHRAQFRARCKYLFENRKRVEVTEKRTGRTYRQNRYFHLIAGWYAHELGYTMEEMKQVIKSEICPEALSYEKDNKTFYRSTGDLDTAQMTIVIDAVRNNAAANGIYLPAPNEQGLIESMEAELSRHGNRQYL